MAVTKQKQEDVRDLTSDEWQELNELRNCFRRVASYAMPHDASYTPYIDPEKAEKVTQAVLDMFVRDTNAKLDISSLKDENDFLKGLVRSLSNSVGSLSNKIERDY